jgi:1,4-alpha-glucan branching enzyme
MKQTARDLSAASPANLKKHSAGSRKSAGRLIPVRFEFTHPAAITVSVAGSFNNWHPTTRSMQPLGGGYWAKEAFLAPGDYEYCLVVDGHWMPDPLARDSVPNPFGGRNSVLHVTESPEAAHRDEAHQAPLKSSKPLRNQKL